MLGFKRQRFVDLLKSPAEGRNVSIWFNNKRHWLNRKINKPGPGLASCSGWKMAAVTGAGSPGRLVQYVVVRSDLVHKLSWPLGAVITQACHAATAAIHLHYGDPDTQRYLAELDAMHKVVLGVSATLPTNIPRFTLHDGWIVYYNVCDIDNTWYLFWFGRIDRLCEF